MAELPDAPTFAEPVLVDKRTGKPGFNPIWLQWFLAVSRILRTTETDHNALTNLQGGAAGEFYHLTAAEQTAISAIGAAMLTFLATPSSANLRAAVTDETGTGALTFANGPTLVAPILGTPASGTLTNCTGLPVASGIAGLAAGIAAFLATPSSANLATALTDEAGTGVVAFATSGVYTPDLLFAGANVGLTYGSRSGSYYRVGNLVFATVDITLTAKGASAGVASISLPVTRGSNLAAAIHTQNMAAVANTIFARNDIIFGPSHFGLTDAGAYLTDANFTNTSVIAANFCYTV